MYWKILVENYLTPFPLRNFSLMQLGIYYIGCMIIFKAVIAMAIMCRMETMITESSIIFLGIDNLNDIFLNFLDYFAVYIGYKFVYTSVSICLLNLWGNLNTKRLNQCRKLSTIFHKFSWFFLSQIREEFWILGSNHMWKLYT